MRWLFIDPTNRQEAAYRAGALEAIESWWREFRKRQPQLESLFAGQGQWDLASWMQQHLGAVDERLMWEFGPAMQGEGHRLVITPEAEHWLRPLVATVLEQAPKIDGWEFYAYRLPELLENAQLAVEARTGGDISQAKFQAAQGGHQKVNLHFALPQCSGPLDADARSAAFIASETMLGEETLDRWVGEITVGPPPKGGLLSTLRGARPQGAAKRFLPLDRLKPTVDALVGSLWEQLPAAPCHQFIHDTEWASYELNPPDEDDYSGRLDLIVAITGRADVFEAAHGGGLFDSHCFSRNGETFCNLKIDGSEGLGDSQFADRSEIEDALNAALIPAELGCTIGGGTGKRYSYVDLALVHLKRGRQTVRDVLLQNGVPKRTWIQFFDDTLSHEWIGIHDDAPPPPQ